MQSWNYLRTILLLVLHRKRNMFTGQLRESFPRGIGLEGKQGDVRRWSVWVLYNSGNFKKQMCCLETAFSVPCFMLSTCYFFLINNNYGRVTVLFQFLGLWFDSRNWSPILPQSSYPAISAQLCPITQLSSLSISTRPDLKLIILSFLNPNQGREEEKMNLVGNTSINQCHNACTLALGPYFTRCVIIDK